MPATRKGRTKTVRGVNALSSPSTSASADIMIASTSNTSSPNSRVDSAEFHAAVYEKIREVPRGKVTTYKHIARLVGHPNHARMVGAALSFLSSANEDENPIPWWRILNAHGGISPRGSSVALVRQRRLLEAEEIIVNDPPREGTVREDGAYALRPGEGGRVSLNQYGWFPDSDL